MPEELLGAYVNCYTFAINKDEAILKVRGCLEEDNYNIISINDCYRADLDQFSIDYDESTGEPTKRDIEEIRESSGVFYANFFGYEKDEQ